MPDTQPKKLTPDEQEKLDDRLCCAAEYGKTEEVQALLAEGADVHTCEDVPLCVAAQNGHTETVQMLLAHGADVYAKDVSALWWATDLGNTEMVDILATHIFAPESWRGKSRAEIEVQAETLYDNLKNHPDIFLIPERLRQAGTILADCAIDCWHQVRPIPQLNISPLPAQPRPL